MSLLPDRMKTVKVVVPVSYQRNLLRFLSTTENIDIIDVQKKPFDINSFEDGPKIKKIKDDFDKMVDHFEIDKKVSKAKAVQIDESSLDAVLKTTETLSNDVIKKLKQIDDRIILAEQELEKNKSVIEIAKNLIPFGFSFQDLDDENPYFQVIVGRIESKRVLRFKWNLDAVTDGNYIFKETSTDKNQAFVAIGFLERYQEEMNRLLAAYGFEKFLIPERITGDPVKIITNSEQKIEQLENRIKELNNEASDIIKEHGPTILAYTEQLEIEENYLKISNTMRTTKRNASVWGWVPTKKTRSIEKNILKFTEKNAIVEFSKPVFDESEYPTKTSVPKFARIYDTLVTAYGVPGYNEFNTAIILQIFFPIMFGLMFADVGHGLLFALLGVYGLTLRNKKLDTSNFMGELKNYFKSGYMLIIVSGISAMIFGFLFGSYFGVTSHYALVKPSFDAMGHLDGPVLTVPTPWFSPESHSPPAYNPNTSSVILMLELSLLVGMIHMTVGYVFRFIKHVKEKHVAEAIFVDIMLAVFHWGLFILVFTFGTNFMTWFQWDNAGYFDMAIIPAGFGGNSFNFFYVRHALLFFIFGLALPILVMSIYLFTHGLDGIAELIELMLSTLSATVSYARIFAMNAVHGALSHIFLLVDFVDPTKNLTPAQIESLEAIDVAGVLGPIHYIGAIVIGGLVILILEGLFSFIQSLRLQWVEFFAKVGYQGTGTKFKAMAFERKYSVPV
jgi:V/A-type H+-transporting ATPase subunit I